MINLVELEKKVKEFNINYKIVHYNYFEQEYRLLSGKILTIIDASIADKQQNKCVKDLIKSEFYRRINDLQNFYFNGVSGHTVNLDQSDSSSSPE